MAHQHPGPGPPCVFSGQPHPIALGYVTTHDGKFSVGSNHKEAVMLKSDDRLVSFDSVDRARSVLADATSLSAVAPYYEEVPKHKGSLSLKPSPVLANTIQALVIYEHVYGDALLFEK